MVSPASKPPILSGKSEEALTACLSRAHSAVARVLGVATNVPYARII